MKSRVLTSLVLWGLAGAFATAVADTGGSSAAQHTKSRDESSSAPLERLQLRAIVSLPGTLLFSLHDPADGWAFWIEESQSRHGFHVESFEPERNVLVLRHGTATRELVLERTRLPAKSDDEITERERLEQRWAAREEERQRFAVRWEAAVEESPELRELVDHFGEVIGEFRELREHSEQVDVGSEEEALLQEQQRGIAAEYRLIEDHGLNLVTELPAFEPEDRETVEILLGLVRQSWLETEMH